MIYLNINPQLIIMSIILFNLASNYNKYYILEDIKQYSV